MDILDDYQVAGDHVRKLLDSKLRLAILEAIEEKPLRLADLRREIGTNAPNASSKAKDLESMGLLERIDGDFSITDFGRASLANTREFLSFNAAYVKFKDFWESHETRGIPPELWRRLGVFKEAIVLKNTETELVATQESFKEFLKSIQEFFYGVTPIFHKEWVSISEYLLEQGVKTKMIATPEVLRLIVENATPNFLDLCSTGDVEIYSMDSITVAFTVTNHEISLAFQKKSPRLTNMDMDLRATNNEAVNWGVELFEHYKKKAEKVDLREFE